jgi:uncharacterized SAM-binding protein YcdF (DUF218 family)
MPMVWWVTLSIVGAVILVGLGAELAQGLASRLFFPTAARRVDAAAAETPAEVVVVLGCPTARDGTVSADQRWRTKIAARSRRPERSLLVFTGAATRGAATTEATTMAGYAHAALGIPREQTALEEKSRSTRENLLFAAPFLEPANSIVLASNPLHAARGRFYLRQSRPDLFARLTTANDYRPGEHPGLKVLATVYEISRLVVRLLVQPMRRHLRRRKHRPS